MVNAEDQLRVEVLLITGLPSSGRSSLLAELLQRLPAGSRVAVCVHRHARAFSLETFALHETSQAGVLPECCVHYTEVYDFGSGCLCCSPDGDLARLLSDLRQQHADLGLTHLLIETTGVADPKPFIRLFDREAASESSYFKLLGVICVVDLVRAEPLLHLVGAHKACGRPSIAERGAAQLHAADVVILNKLDELRAQVLDLVLLSKLCSVRTLLNSIALEGDTDAVKPAMLGPVTRSCVQIDDLYAALHSLRGCRHLAAAARGFTKDLGLGMAMPQGMFSMSFGPGAGTGHEASCETVCLVLPRGGVCLDAAIATLQALLSGGEAFRIQGYLSFLAIDVEQEWASDNCNNGGTFPPPIERAWAMPVVVVEGVYRGSLSVRAVEVAAAPGAPARAADDSGKPWQETALEAASADRGGCKVFICGCNLDERALRSQLARTAAPGFQGPVCDLERLTPMATQIISRIDEAVAAEFEAGLGDSLGTSGPGLRADRGLALERAAAEVFAQRLASALRDVLPQELIKPVITEAFETPVRLIADGRGSAPLAATLRWAGCTVSVRPEPTATAAPLGLSLARGAGGEVPCRMPFGSSELRLCVDASGVAGISEQEVRVVGTDVYCRRSKSL